jgi:hypothetical protein
MNPCTPHARMPAASYPVLYEVQALFSGTLQSAHASRDGAKRYLDTLFRELAFHGLVRERRAPWARQCSP